MAATIRYFAATLDDEEHPVKLQLRDESASDPKLLPKINCVGIISPSMRVSKEILYIDLGDDVPSTKLYGKSVVTSKDRADLFRNCDRIVMQGNYDPHEVFWLLSDTLSALLKWRAGASMAASRSDGLQELMDITSSFLDNPAYLSNAGLKVLASTSLDLEYISPTWRYQKHYGYLSYDMMQTLIDNGELHHMGSTTEPYIVQNPSIYSLPYLCCPILQESEIMGYVFFIGLYRDLGQQDIEIAEELAAMLAQSTWAELDRQVFDGISQAYFVESVLDGSLTDPLLIDRQIRALPQPFVGDFALFLFDTRSDNDAVRHHIMALLATEFAAQCLVYNEYVVGIFSTYSKIQDEVRKGLGQILADYDRMGALSEPFLRFEDLPRYYSQALFALQLGTGKESSANHGQLIEYSTVFFNHISSLIGSEVTEYAPAVRLIKYDTKHGSDLARSLLVWLRCERNTMKASNELFIHRNTLSYRLDKAAKILKVDMDDWSVQSRLLYSLRDIDTYAHLKPSSSEEQEEG